VNAPTLGSKDRTRTGLAPHIVSITGGISRTPGSKGKRTRQTGLARTGSNTEKSKGGRVGMAYRKFDTGTWTSPDFENMEPLARYLFIYLWTNEHISQSGIYKITFRRIAFETKINESDIEPLLYSMGTVAELLPEKQSIWVYNFFRRQCQNGNFARSALSFVTEKYPEIAFSWISRNKIVFDRFGVSIPKKLLISNTGDTNGEPLGVASYRYRTEQNRTDTEQNRAEQKNKAFSFQEKARDARNSSNHFEHKTGSHFEAILSACQKIETLPRKKIPFNPFQWVQKWTNKNGHPGAILESLQGIIEYWPDAEKPFAYIETIMRTKNGNFNEREAIEQSAQFKAEWKASESVAKLLKGIG
jgi:hypothetical protein